ncbi:MAG TPA: M42 family metallopeptidase [Chloroflexota bacterium]|nr:M42 family metallopeptidase [Chloroflexota bacterium]
MNFELLKRLCETPGVAGHEDALRAVVREELGPLVDEVRTDPLGNVIAIKRGTAQRSVMLAAHMDEIGFIVKWVDGKGFLRLHPLGGFDPNALFAQRVIVHGTGGALPGVLMPSVKPIHLRQGDPKPLNLDDYFVDLGLPSETIAASVEIGDMVTLERATVRTGDCVTSKALDDRLGLYVMIEAVRAARDPRATILAVATVQEEVGLRGAQTAAEGLHPDIGVALDVTLALDLPGESMADQHSVTRLGAGTAIKLTDGSSISDHRLVTHFRRLARRENIPHQLEILPRGGTDAGAIQRSGAGVPSITLSIPTRYVHTVDETAHVDDIQASVDLLARFLEEAHQLDLSYP